MKNKSSSLSLKIQSSKLQLSLGQRDEDDNFRQDADKTTKVLKLLPND